MSMMQNVQEADQPALEMASVEDLKGLTPSVAEEPRAEIPHCSRDGGDAILGTTSEPPPHVWKLCHDSREESGKEKIYIEECKVADTLDVPKIWRRSGADYAETKDSASKCKELFLKWKLNKVNSKLEESLHRKTRKETSFCLKKIRKVDLDWVLECDLTKKIHAAGNEITAKFDEHLCELETSAEKFLLGNPNLNRHDLENFAKKQQLEAKKTCLSLEKLLREEFTLIVAPSIQKKSKFSSVI